MSLSKHKNMEDLVKSYINFTGPPANNWWPCYCEYCGDGSRTKGPRGGWLFTEDAIFYNCFNQGCEGSYSEERDYPLSKNMMAIFEAFGIPKREYSILKLEHSKNKTSDPSKPKIHRTPIQTIEVPKHFYLLSEAYDDDVIAEEAKKYLATRRIDWKKYPYYLSTGDAGKNADPREKMTAKILRDRLIIPAFKGESMIHYHSRTLDPKVEKNKYINMDGPRSNIIYNMDRIYENPRAPLFVTEGFFDSFLLNGVCVLENGLSSQQVEILNRSPRKKVIVPDRNGDSKKLALDAIEAGFGISLPKWGGAKDVNAAVKKYGRLYVAKTVVENAKFGVQAKMVLKMHTVW